MCEYPIIINERIVRGRKNYRCGECWDLIPKGTPHEYVNGLWGGGIGWDSHRTCDVCVELRNYITNLPGADCMSYGGLRDAVFEDIESVDRSLLPGQWLLDIHEQGDEDRERTPSEEAADSVKHLCGGLMTYFQDMRSPKKWARRQEASLKRIAESTRLLNYLRKKRDDGEALNSYEEKLLTGAFV